MAWVTPVTDRTDSSARMTYIDMNRIVGNINHIYDAAVAKGIQPAGSKISKTSFTRNDILTKVFWEGMLNTLTNVCDAIGYYPQTQPDNIMSYDNINNIESITLTAYQIIGVIDQQGANNHWVGDQWVTGDPINVGGTY